jgi:hypothetical protein
MRSLYQLEVRLMRCVNDPLGSRIDVAIVYPVAPLYEDGDVALEDVDRHPYLLCLCGGSLLWGVTTDGAPILGCGICRWMLDERRVA